MAATVAAATMVATAFATLTTFTALAAPRMTACALRQPFGGENMAVTTACVSVCVFHESDIIPDISYFKIYRDMFLF
ncbi:hypothetical protein AA15237_1517 [Komagataeibacter xylinus NBRC 15237]|nr:hypothetical protein AA15237_1517 [Komagataeibacter xylinus NBRC 15237]